MKRFLIGSLGFVLAVGLASVALAATPSGEKSVTGTLEDSFCYLTMGSHGASHKKCAISCAKVGIPVALVESGSKKIFVLMPAKNGESLPNDVIDKMEDKVTVTGTEYSQGGTNFITVDSVK